MIGSLLLSAWVAYFVGLCIYGTMRIETIQSGGSSSSGEAVLLTISWLFCISVGIYILARIFTDGTILR